MTAIIAIIGVIRMVGMVAITDSPLIVAVLKPDADREHSGRTALLSRDTVRPAAGTEHVPGPQSGPEERMVSSTQESDPRKLQRCDTVPRQTNSDAVGTDAQPQ